MLLNFNLNNFLLNQDSDIIKNNNQLIIIKKKLFDLSNV